MIVGNWKMNPATLDEAKKIGRKTRNLASKLIQTEVVVCPPFPFVSAAGSRKNPSNYFLGAQSVSFVSGGPHTGEVSVSMLKSLGTKYVIVGHSEERLAGDGDEIVAKRAGAVVEAGLTPILCVGEKTRDENGSHFDFIRDQIKGSLANISKLHSRDIVLAYEPVWAIGAKEAMQPADVYEMSLFVKKVFADIFGTDSGTKVTVLYGGSVNFRNAADIISIGKVDGLLVGRESVNIPGFSELLKTVDKVR